MTEGLALGLAAAAAFGLGDLLQGVSSRRLPTSTVVVVGQAAGLLVVVVFVPLAAETSPSAAALSWGAGAGAAAAAGTGLLVRGFRVGNVGTVSPTASVTAAGLPLVVDLASGTRLGLLPTLGLGLGLVATWLVGRRPMAAARDDRVAAGGAVYGAGAGTAHAALYVCLDQAGAEEGAWPVLALYVVMVTLAVAAAGLRNAPLRVAPRYLPALLSAGLLGAGGTVLFLLATSAGTVGVAAVLSELSPVLTVILARAALAEPLPATRLAGLLTAAVALVLISSG